MLRFAVSLLLQALTLYVFLSLAKKAPSTKEEFTRQKQEELEKRLEDVSGKLGMPKKLKKSQ